MTNPDDIAIERARERIDRIREQLGELQYLSSGSLIKRFKRCGHPRCVCAKDPAARHGPYYELGYMKDGKLRHRTLSPEQAKLMRRAIANYRKVRRLLRLWEAQTQRLIDLNVPEQS